MRGLGGGDGFFYYFWSGKVFYVLEVLFYELGLIVVVVVLLCSYGFFIEYVVVEVYDVDIIGFEDVEDIGEDFFGLF